LTICSASSPISAPLPRDHVEMLALAPVEQIAPLARARHNACVGRKLRPVRQLEIVLARGGVGHEIVAMASKEV